MRQRRNEKPPTIQQRRMLYKSRSATKLEIHKQRTLNHTHIQKKNTFFSLQMIHLCDVSLVLVVCMRNMHTTNPIGNNITLYVFFFLFLVLHDV